VYLKSLTLKGFKSFAEAATLDLEPGVTVVVGPNGSGKSNVVDAVAWVLGAQAPSSVRSQKMDDVIFAGSSQRAALGRAEVALTIDNTSGMLPIEFNEVTITRTLFRTGESEYALNGVPCRLLDIQDLLSDSGVGRQQHVIVSQGQIDAVLNAKPEDRRSVIEEAAGVLKFRKRKERSERRLAATEANLTRLQDLLREVRRQLRPLERQADAARRHGGLVAELTALRVHLAGRQIAGLRQRLTAVHAERAELRQSDEALARALAEADTRVLQAESRLAAAGGDDVGDDLVAFEHLSERARGLAAVLTERRRGVGREQASVVDGGVIASLESESERVRTELGEVDAEVAGFADQAAALAAAERELDAERTEFEALWSDGVVAPSGRAAEVRGEASALRSGSERDGAELERVRAKLATLEERSVALVAEAERLRVELAEADAAEIPLVEAIEGAEQWCADAESAVAGAEADLAEHDGELRSWRARAEALELALDEARAAAGAQRLAGVDGVLGTLLDLVDVDPGWEAAFEAAAGEALAAVVVADHAAARAALATLHGDGMAGAVLALGGGARRPSPPTGVGSALRDHVRARGDARGVEVVLDAVVDGAVVVDGGWDAALDAALAHPDATVLTSTGDRFGPGGWRLGQAGAGATGAALDDARARTEQAAVAAEGARTRVEGAKRAAAEAHSAEQDLSARLDEHDGRRSAAADGLQRAESERRDASTEAEALQAHLAELEPRHAQATSRLAELEVELPRLEAEEADQLERGRQVSDARARLDERAAEVGGMRTDLEVRTAAIDGRRQLLARRLAELDERLERSSAERAEAAERRQRLERDAAVLARLAELVAERASVIDERLDELRDRRRAQSEAARSAAAELDGLRRDRASTEEQLRAVRERLGRNEVNEAEITMRLEAAVESLRSELDCEPAVAEAAPQPELPEGTAPAARVRELERELRLMGPINPLALEEFDALSARHEFLQGQLDDVRASRRELHKVINAIDEEIVKVFAAAFADVAANFEHLFATLFPGGTGRLKLTEPDDLLATGIEVEAKPSGKNVKKLSLLSGGERSLTALAYLFAVFRSRPSPFYVMDEVEAALDDVNLHRFLGLVQEFRGEAQLVIVSHQKRTMEAADLLYGVTMQPGGSSKVVSEKVNAS
jgi:chromosome segregation protein